MKCFSYKPSYMIFITNFQLQLLFCLTKISATHFNVYTSRNCRISISRASIVTNPNILKKKNQIKLNSSLKFLKNQNKYQIKENRFLYIFINIFLAILFTHQNIFIFNLIDSDGLISIQNLCAKKCYTFSIKLFLLFLRSAKSRFQKKEIKDLNQFILLEKGTSFCI